MDLKAQSKHHQKNCPVRMHTKLFEVKIGKIETIFRFLDALKRDKIGGKICLNISSKTDKESSRCDDTAFLSELIANSR